MDGIADAVCFLAWVAQKIIKSAKAEAMQMAKISKIKVWIYFDRGMMAKPKMEMIPTK